MKLTNSWYDALKWQVIVFLPALTTLVATVGQVFEFDYTNHIVTLMTAFTAFLGSLVGVSSVTYKKENEDLK